MFCLTCWLVCLALDNKVKHANTWQKLFSFYHYISFPPYVNHVTPHRQRDWRRRETSKSTGKLKQIIRYCFKIYLGVTTAQLCYCNRQNSRQSVFLSFVITLRCAHFSCWTAIICSDLLQDWRDEQVGTESDFIVILALLKAAVS